MKAAPFTMTNVKRQTKNNKISNTGIRRIDSRLYYLMSIIIIFSIWIILSLTNSESQRRFLLPHPVEVGKRMLNMVANGTLIYHISITLLEMGLGLAAGTVTALILGYFVAHNALFAYMIEPIIVVSQAIPIVALAPLLTVWFGPGLISKIVVCSLIVFFPILVNVVTGLKSIQPHHQALFQLLEATPTEKLMHLEIPSALPSLFSGLKIGGTLSGMGAVVGEFVASTKGLGYLVKQGQNLYDLPMMFVAIFTLMAITITIYLCLSLLETS
ncbi:MAG: ABC transporter permease, partial [Anaerolineae bacterium]|nr:ABC transporter permease [Anaerolineae bacterium]